MTTFQESKEHVEHQMLIKLMTRLEDDPIVSQRNLASELGVALGLMNTYLKRCIKKGWIRVNQVPAKRIAYFLTPEGFKEKSRMVKQYLASSLSFFRDARSQCKEAFILCNQRGWKRIAMVGEGDLAEIASLVAHGTELELNLVESHIHSFEDYDAVLITDILQPQKIYDHLKYYVNREKVLTLGLLHISLQECPENKNREDTSR